MTYFDEVASTIEDGMLDIGESLDNVFNDIERELNVANGKVHCLFSSADSNVSAYFVTNDGINIQIPQINYPKEFSLIDSVEKFDKFLENAYARVTMLDDDEPNLQVFQKGYGGSGKDKKINISTPSQPPAASQPPSQPVTWNVNAGYSGNGRVEPGKGGNVVIQGGVKFRF